MAKLTGSNHDTHLRWLVDRLVSRVWFWRHHIEAVMPTDQVGQYMAECSCGGGVQFVAHWSHASVITVSTCALGSWLMCRGHGVALSPARIDRALKALARSRGSSSSAARPRRLV